MCFNRTQTSGKGVCVMNKIKNLLLAFAIVGLLVSVSITKVEAQCPSSPSNECFECCKNACNAAQFKSGCSGATGEDAKDCRTLANIRAECCYFNCLDSFCGIDAGDSITCESLEELCS